MRARAATWSGCAIFGQCCAQLPARMALVIFASCSLCFPGTRQLPRLLAVRSSFEKIVAALPPPPLVLSGVIICCSMPRCINASRWHGHQGTRRPLSGVSGTPRRARHFVLVLHPVIRIEIWFPESAANRQGGSTTLFGAWLAMLHTSRSNRLMLHRHGIAPLALLPGTVGAAMDGVPLSRPFPCPDVQ